MEDVDRILIHALKQIGTDVSEDIDGVSQFSSELIVNAVVRCIQVIDPSLGNALPSCLPPGMSARFRVGMSLAQACQEIGYKGEIGYQTFLYSNEPEIRSLLMCLVEKLPRENAEASDQPTGKSLNLQKAIASAIKAQLNVPWLHTTCKLPIHIETQHERTGELPSFHALPLSLSHFVKSPNSKKLKEAYEQDILPPVTSQLTDQASLFASLLEEHTSELSAAQEWDNDWNSQGLLSRLTPQEYRSRKLTRLHKRIQEQLRCTTLPSPQSTFGGSHSTSNLCELLQVFKHSDRILTMGTHFNHTQRFTYEQESGSATNSIRSGHQSDGDIQHSLQGELDLVQLKFQQASNDFNKLRADMRNTSVTYTQVQNELKHRGLMNSEKIYKLQVKKKTIDLLPDMDGNKLNLQGLVEASTLRLVNLASQWEKHRSPLIDEYRRLKEMCSNQDLESSRKLCEIKSLHSKICESTEEARKKEDIYKQLVTELDNLLQDASRSAYTQRILEIVSNIKKQKEEISKILSDTKELQKEINNLTGKLDRTFAVTDELVFKDAKKDESVRKSYKYLAALHENCNQLIQTIEETGTIMREIRDLEEQIETENGSTTVSNLERILDDYKAIRKENSALAAKVRED